MQCLNPEYKRELLETVNSSPFPQHLSIKLVSIDINAAKVELETAGCHLRFIAKEAIPYMNQPRPQSALGHQITSMVVLPKLY